MVDVAVKDGNEAIARAAQAIASSDRNLKLAAGYLAFAEAEGKTQRQMAEGVGKSAAWVNRLLQWRRAGFHEDTPFGAQSQERDERHDERIREQRSGPTRVKSLIIQRRSHRRTRSNPLRTRPPRRASSARGASWRTLRRKSDRLYQRAICAFLPLCLIGSGVRTPGRSAGITGSSR
jgi:hypothetical protein